MQFRSSPQELALPRIWLIFTGSKNSSKIKVQISFIEIPILIISFSPSSLLKTLTLQGKGVADGLRLSDLSVSRTNHPTTNRCLPSRLIIGSGQSITASLCRFSLCGLQTIPQRLLRNPYGFA
ncbi:hypothetical protein AVEN_274430-1 [Araneus ventricosus]|uniref:Uncharacterized protein n=1 Tax=Araneus ventricosus TaxID=182803 RepID=A0A4Y2F393_ARAVE|nr:hypothetical protein AVEN_274430-1 [Araneus ventricosus]